jgi:hypothetical protein
LPAVGCWITLRGQVLASSKTSEPNTTSVAKAQVHSRDLVPFNLPVRFPAVKQQLHQASFRLAVITAYNGSSAARDDQC